MIRTGRVYDLPSPDDGQRLLVMRYWPRGVRKERVDAWNRALAPSAPLVRDFKAGRITWETFAERYRQEMQAQAGAIAELAERGQRETITILCSCADENRCHRSILKKLVQQSDP